MQSTFKGAQEAVKSKWQGFKDGNDSTPKGEAEKHRPKMSSGFNQASFEGVDVEDNLDHSIDGDPDIGAPS